MKEQIKQILTNICTMLRIFFKSLYAFGKEQYQKSLQKRLLLQQLQQQQAQQRYLYAMTQQMSADLYEAFNDSSYSLLIINSPKSIRYHSISPSHNGCTQYNFKIDKANTSFANCVLQDIQDEMNDDIAATQYELSSLYGNMYMKQYYPFLYYGMTVKMIKNLNKYSILIGVETNPTPAQFCQVYRPDLL